jgi:hypothetical protein
MANFLSQLTSPPAQTLRILQPTSSTITYTVSSRPVPSTLPAKALLYIGILLRVLLGFATVIALRAKWMIKDAQSIDYLRAALGSTEKEAQLLKAISACPWVYLAPGVAGVLFLVFRRAYTGTIFLLLPIPRMSSKFCSIQLLRRYRGIFNPPPRSRCADEYYIVHVPPDAHHALHTYD